MELGVGCSFVSGMAANYIGTSIKNILDGSARELSSLLLDSAMFGTLNLIPGIGGSILEGFLNPIKYNLNVSNLLGKSIGMALTLTVETIYDALSALVTWLMSFC